ncbi:MAG: YdcF family protein [Thermoguttaceae bacterium]|jgi:uncharacterized SAM-binding protein YcdF (DUF218 family)
MRVRRVGCLLVLGLAGCLLAAVALGRGRLLPAVAAWLDVGEPPQRADAVLVLLGTPDTRAMAAAALVKGGWASRVMLNTDAPTPEVERGIVPSSEEVHRRMLIRCGVPPEDIIVLDSRVRTTYDEVAALAGYLDSSPQTRVLVVTEGPHTRRARWILRHVLGDRARQTRVVSVPMEECQTDSWWQNETGFAFVASEYLKLGFYAVRYGPTGNRAAYGALAAIAAILAWWAYRRHRATARGSHKR